MARNNNVNYQSAGTEFQIASADTDPFDRDDVSKLAAALDLHTHDTARGLGVKRLDGAVGTIGVVAFNGIQTFNDRPHFAEGAAVASAASIALGDDGIMFLITGTATITTITAKAQGAIAYLRFASTAILAPGGNLVGLPGKFCAKANAVCLLYCDGTSWLLVSGQGNKPFMAIVRRTTDQTLAAGGSIVSFSSDGEDYDPGGMWASGAPTRFSPGVAGIYEAGAVIQIEDDVENDVSLRFLKTGATIRDVQHHPDHASGSSGDLSLSGSIPVVLSSVDYIEYRADRQNNDGGVLDNALGWLKWIGES